VINLGFLSDALDDLERREKRRNPRKKILALSQAEYHGVPDSTLVPKKDLSGLTYTDVAVKRLRPKDRLFFDLDVHGLEGTAKEIEKAKLLERLLSHATEDFDKGFSIFSTADGWHLEARIRPKDWKKLFAKYKNAFPESDFIDTGERLGLRISPKISLTTGDIDSPAPRTIISTFKKPRRKATKFGVYLTNK